MQTIEFSKMPSNLEKTIVLSTERLKLRPLSSLDSPKLIEIVKDKKIASTTNIPYPYKDGIIEKWLDSSFKRFKKNESVRFAIINQSTQGLIGAVGIELESPHVRGKLWFWLEHKEWGKGYCTEAVGAVLKYGFNDLKLNRIYAESFITNSASERVLQKTGFKQEGLLKKHAEKLGIFHDINIYGLLLADYREA